MTVRTRAFAEADVFRAAPYYGNPVAVVCDGARIPDEANLVDARLAGVDLATAKSLTPVSAGLSLR